MNMSIFKKGDLIASTNIEGDKCEVLEVETSSYSDDCYFYKIHRPAKETVFYYLEENPGDVLKHYSLLSSNLKELDWKFKKGDVIRLKNNDERYEEMYNENPTIEITERKSDSEEGGQRYVIGGVVGVRKEYVEENYELVVEDLKASIFAMEKAVKEAEALLVQPTIDRLLELRDFEGLQKYLETQQN